jgi:hypothetical protein
MIFVKDTGTDFAGCRIFRRIFGSTKIFNKILNKQRNRMQGTFHFPNSHFVVIEEVTFAKQICLKIYGYVF